MITMALLLLLLLIAGNCVRWRIMDTLLLIGVTESVLEIASLIAYGVWRYA